MMSFWDVFLQALLQGWAITLEMLVLAIPVSVILGLSLAIARVYGNRPVSLIAAGFVGLFRGLPLIVTLLIIFFALPRLGLYFPPFWAAVVGFIFCSGAYQSEYVRGAIRSIEVGQSLAAQSLGMSKSKEIFHIILPQAFRRAFPGITNEIIYLILYSSLAYVVGVSEIFAVSKHYNSLYFRSIEIFSTAAVIYLFMASIASIGFRKLENRLRIPGLEMTR
jgi:polar amino acid transport system permease protein